MTTMRDPWAPDSTTRRQDERIEMASPSLRVVPPKVIHTSCNTNAGGVVLPDIFAPPRMDFSSKPGNLANANEYPMPERASAT